MFNKFGYYFFGSFNSLRLEAKFFLFVLLFIVFEGVFIKWMGVPRNLPLLLQDLICLILVCRAVYYDRFTAYPELVGLVIVWTFILVFFGFVQTIFNQTNPLLLLVGFRFNVLYLWFAIAACCTISRAEMKIIAMYLVACAVITAPLVITQSFLPPSHMLNSLPDTESENIFVLAGDVVRTTGTFIFTFGFTCFLALITPFFLQQFFDEDFKYSIYIKSIVLICLMAMVFVCGSRAGLVWFSMMFFVAFFANLIVNIKFNKRNSQSLIFSIIVIFICIFSATILFSGQIDAMQDRFLSAGEHETIAERLYFTFLGESFVMEQFTLLGSGIGTGANAASVLTKGVNTFLLAESEPGRIILELGLLGLIYISIKWIVGLFFILKSCSILLKSGDFMPLLLWVSTLYAFNTWAISGQLTANSMGYSLLAFSLVFTFNHMKIKSQ